MMVDHATDDLLSAYAFDPLLVPDRGVLEEHLAACAACQARLASIRAFDALLEDPASWPEDEASSARTQLLQRDALRRREDRDAEELLGSVLGGTSGSFVFANLAEKPKYHTGGVVRRLIGEAARACYAQPLHALNVADTAIAIASALSERRYTATDLASWRGTAWKMRANALRLLGRHPRGLDALVRAERYYRTLPRPELDLAAVHFIRATILYEQEEYGAAAELADAATRAFGELGQSEMYLSGRLLQGSIAFETRQLATAERIFRDLHSYGEAADSPVWIARASQALGNCCIETGALDTATQCLTTALRLFTELEVVIEEIRCRWGLARIAQKSGKVDAAIVRLKAAREEFARMGVATDAALVTLDLVESYLAQRKWGEVQRAARDTVRLFQEAGMLTGALTAANWLRHAARMKALTPSILDVLRRYFKRVSVQPDFVFLPPVQL